MKIEGFDCCHAYNKCSDAGRCVNDFDHMSACGYWNRHLSKGVSFYGKNPGLREGNIFIEIGGRSFRISKRSKEKDLSYAMGREHIKALQDEFKSLGIDYSIAAKGLTIIAGCPENPARYKVDFEIGDLAYTIKNHNGYLLEIEAAQQIIKELGGRIKLTPNPQLRAAAPPAQRNNQEFGEYYGRGTAFVFDAPKTGLPKEPRPPERQPMCGHFPIEKQPEQPIAAAEPKDPGGNMKLPKGEELKQGKWAQVSIWDIMYAKQ